MTTSVLLSPAPSDTPSPALSYRSGTHVSRPNPTEQRGGQYGHGITDNLAQASPQVQPTSGSSSASHQSSVPVDGLRSPSPIGPAQPMANTVRAFVPSARKSSSLSMPTPSLTSGAVPGSHTSQFIELDQAIPSFYSSPTIKKRKRTEETLAPWLQRMMYIIDTHSKTLPLNADFERPRILLLREACATGDVFYVALHQIFCLWSLDPSGVLAIPGLREHNDLTFAFETIGHWLRRNDGLSLHHLRWLSNFPSPLYDLLSKSEPYRDLVADVGLFLSRLTSSWISFFQRCKRRGYPPLVEEMVIYLGLPSPVLRRIIFIATRRNMQITDGPRGQAVDQIFAQDQQSHEQLISQPASPAMILETQERTRSIGVQYRSILTEASPPGQRRTSAINGSHSSSAAFQQRSVSYSQGHLPSPTPVVPSHGQSYMSPYSSVQARHTPSTLQPSTIWQAGNANGVVSDLVNQGSLSRQQSAYEHQVQQLTRQMQHGAGGSQPTPSSYLPSNIPANNPLNARPHLSNQEVVSSPGAIQPSITGVTPVRGNASRQSMTLNRPLVPQAGVAPAPGPTNPNMTALHQSHLTSPRLVPLESNPNHGAQTRFYQVVKGFVLEPQRIPPTSSLSTFQFNLSEYDWAMIAKDKKLGNEPVPFRSLKRGVLQYRLRCVSFPSKLDNIPMSDWVVSDATWPEFVFLELNEQILEVRRKTHHGKDLPVDITPYIIPPSAGTSNTLKLAVMQTKKPRTDVAFYAAIEVIEIMSHNQIIDMCLKSQHIPSSKTLAGIARSLAKSLSPTTADDDVSVVATDLSIDLADPFSSKIFEVPVRGANCLHRECFDLEIFLQTRPAKPKHPGQPCMVDVWKCPLCKKDARPYNLVIDDFLVSVRKELAEQNCLHYKAILVSADGSWKPKFESRSLGSIDDSEDSDADIPVTAKKSDDWLSGKEVIALDDD